MTVRWKTPVVLESGLEEVEVVEDEAEAAEDDDVGVGLEADPRQKGD